MNNRNRTLDIYKGILIVLVVLRHVLQYSVSDEGGTNKLYLGGSDARIYADSWLFCCKESK